MSIQHRFLILISVLALTSCDREGESRISFQPDIVRLEETDNPDYMVLVRQNLTFTDSRHTEWTAPVGTYTDGATVPRMLLPITNGRFQKEFLKAAVVHDAYCQKENETRTPEQYQSMPWRKVHRMFHEASLAGGTSSSVAYAMYLAVWVFGPRWDDPERELTDVSDEMRSVFFNNSFDWVNDTEPSLDEIESWMDEREPALIKVSKLESKGLSALSHGNQKEAEEALQQAEHYISERLEELPNDVVLLHLKGHLHKNMAIRYHDLNMEDKENRELNKAVESFQEIIRIEPKDTSALNGLGRIWILRDDLDRADGFVEKALSVDPNNPAAIRKRDHINHMRKVRPLPQ